MEQPTPRTAVAMPWLLLLCLATSGVLQGLAQSSSTSGFISIDCGLPGETGYTTNDRLSYTTDAGFIDANAGSNHNVAVEYIQSSSSPNLWWNTLRSFPSGVRNCYTLGSLVAGLKYLIRAKFDLYLGVDFWTTVIIPQSSSSVYTEAIVVVPQDSMQVCLVNTGGGVPFISGLDVRPLKDKLYPQTNATQGLSLVGRYNFGATDRGGIGYPDDPYDRLWYPFPYSTTPPSAVISTRMNVQIKDGGFQPPSAVMRTAITTTGNVSNNLAFSFAIQTFPTDPSLGYIHTFYFSELQQLSTNALREFNIYRNDIQTTTAYTPPYLADDIRYSVRPIQDSQYRISLNATARSTLPPIINAIELFSVIPTTTVATDSQDVSAITAIKGMYQVQKNWMGDPCVPKTMVWDGLNCSSADSKPPIISNVNMSFSGLNGAISPNFANLKDVQYLDLSNNNLIGSIPDALSQLPSLVFLDLSNNKLNGSIPSGLQKQNQAGSLDLRYGNNPDLCSDTSCKLDEGDSKGGKNKLAIYIGVLIVVIMTLHLVAILCLCVKRRRKRGESLNWNSEMNMGGDGDPRRKKKANTHATRAQLRLGRSRLSVRFQAKSIVAALLLYMSLCFLGVVPKQAKAQGGGPPPGSCGWVVDIASIGSIKNSVEPTNDGDGNISLELENRQFTYMELETITNNFQRQIGRGGFGYVFHGSLENGTEVAVKLRSHSSNQGVREFLAEAQVLTRIHYKYLVSMIGFCTDREHMALVYEYMPQGTLQEHIAGEGGNGRGLPWRQRLRIALESAQGLEYLHKGCSPPIIHRDVKTTNILLNAKLEVKIADFGLSKAYNCDDDTHLSTNIFAGTYGYVDPEYQRTMQPSTKSDVYSFGVMLLELVTGQPAILRNPEPITLIDWARQRLARGDIDGVVDARMQGDYDINAVWKTTEIALKCTERSPLQRPSMTDVVMQLQECLDLEEGSTGGDSGFYTGSGIGGMNPNMGYSATSQENAILR